MSVSLLQAILIGLWAGFGLAGQLWGTYTQRPLILSIGVGVILGDIPTALKMGAIGEIAFMGLVGAGGSVPPHQLGPGIIGTLMAITMKDTGMTPDMALALSFPFAVVCQFLVTFAYTSVAGVTGAAITAVEEGKYTKYKLLSNSTIIAFILIGFGIGFGASISMQAVERFVNFIPEWIINGFSVAGGLLPAVGFGIILNVLMEKQYIPFAILGYVCVSYLNVPVMGVALIALVFGLYDYFSREDIKDMNENLIEEVVEDGI